MYKRNTSNKSRVNKEVLYKRRSLLTRMEKIKKSRASFQVMNQIMGLRASKMTPFWKHFLNFIYSFIYFTFSETNKNRKKGCQGVEDKSFDREIS